jgi:hypothetical protein
VGRTIWSSRRVHATATPDFQNFNAATDSAHETGSVTAELATALPAIVLIGSALLDLFAGMAVYLHTSQIAQRAAEAVTRHEEMAGIEQMVARALPTSHLAIVIQGDYSLVKIDTPAPWPKSIKINASAIAHN